MGNMTKAKFINFFSSLYFYLPIAILWYQSRGLTLQQVQTLASFGIVTYMMTTVPTGIFADRSLPMAFLFMGGLIVVGAFVFRINEEQLVGEVA